jgi:hypothetical protein
MAKINLRKQLFNDHCADLQRVVPSKAGLFYCPICMSSFSRIDLQKGSLTDGHVWSETFVKNHTTSLTALDQRVLLCHNCNSKSGTRNESSLIEFEQFRKTRESGQYYRPSISVMRKTDIDIKPIELGQLPAKFTGETDIQISFPKNRKTGHPTYNPYEKEKFEEVVRSSSCTIVVEEKFPHKEKWLYSQASLLTSAYLMAFRVFGYRFILHTCYSPIRSYILKSFEQNVDERLNFSESTPFSVRICNTHYYEEPLLYIIPESSNQSQKIEVSFLDYHIVLPLPPRTPRIREINPTEKFDTFIDFTRHKPHKGECSVEKIFYYTDYQFSD